MPQNAVALQLASRVHNHLQALFRERGRGTKAQVERHLGLYSGYFDGRRARGDIGVGILMAALNYLKVDAAEFLAEASGLANDDPPPPARWPATKAIARQRGLPILDDEDAEE